MKKLNFVFEYYLFLYPHIKNLLDVVEEQRNQELSANQEHQNRLPNPDRINQNNDRGKLIAKRM